MRRVSRSPAFAATARRVAFGWPMRIVAGLIVAYLLFAWLGFEPLVRWLAPKVVAERSAHQLSIERARLNPFQLTLRLGGVKLADPEGKPLLAFGELLVDFQVASLFKRAYTFKEVRLTEPNVQLDIDAQGRLNWMRLIDAFAGAPRSEPAQDHEPLRFLIQHAVLQKGRVGFEDHRGDGLRAAAEPLDLELHDLSTLPDDKGDHVLALRTSFGAQVRWKGELGLNPLAARGEIAVDNVQLARVWPLLRSPLRIAPPEGSAGLTFSYRVEQVQGRLAVRIEQLALQVQALALRGADERAAAIALDRVAVSGGRVDLADRTVSLDAIQVDGGRVALERAAEGRLSVQHWLPAPKGNDAAAPAASSTTEAPWRVALGRVALDGVACHVVDRGFAAPLTADVGRAQIAFKADGEFGGGSTKLVVDGLGVELQKLHVGSGERAQPLLELDAAQLTDGRIDLAQQHIALGKVTLRGAKTTLTRDARGELSLLAALKPAQDQPSAPDRGAAAGGAAPWHYRLERIEADAEQVALRDESTQPPMAVTLQQVHAEAGGLSDDANAALPVRLSLRAREGGRFEVEGTVTRTGPSADLRVKLDELALQPAQPLLAQATTLTLAGGRASTAGRVRVQGGTLRYDGAFDIKDLLLNETANGERFLAWKSLGTQRLVATTERLDIDELRVAGLDAKLLIAKDRTINVAKILKPRPGEAKKSDSAKTRASKSDAAPRASKPPAYGVKVARVRVNQSDIDFADLSLALPFAARIHGLQGQLVGLSNAPGGAAQLELQGQVDEYGLSRAAGQINLFDPGAFTDIRVIFQNVEMTRLTPYSATFAGRKIASGKLSLDLQYKVKARQLTGDNQVVMERLTLGERVDSPEAPNLPLDLALAILQDQDGKIDLGLPVSGSLDDPQFSIGGIVWKAIVNVLTKVVTAPFRALGALFGGGGDEQTAKVAFDAGETELLPPERDKIRQLAQAVAKRPRLSVGVHAAWDPAADGNALKDHSMRRALAAQMGRQVAAGDDTGPVSTADPKAREAIEAMYRKRFGTDALQQMHGKFEQANPGPPPTDAAGRLVSRLANLFKRTPPPLSAEESAQLTGADLHARLLERLRDAEPLSDEQLRALGAARAQAISRELVADGVAADRIAVDTPRAADGRATISLGAVAKEEQKPPALSPTATAAAPRLLKGAETQ